MERDKGSLLTDFCVTILNEQELVNYYLINATNTAIIIILTYAPARNNMMHLNNQYETNDDVRPMRHLVPVKSFVYFIGYSYFNSYLTHL